MREVMKNRKSLNSGLRGKVLKLLTEGDMKEMGLTAIGDRRLLNHLLQQVHKLYYNLYIYT